MTVLLAVIIGFGLKGVLNDLVPDRPRPARPATPLEKFAALEPRKLDPNRPTWETGIIFNPNRHCRYVRNASEI